MSGLVDKITKAVMGISAIVVFVITFLQVLCRFVLKSPLPWSTDILRLAFTYLVFWGAAWCVREKEHLNVDVLLMSFPVKIRKVVELGIDLVLSLFFIFMIVFGIKFCAKPICDTVWEYEDVKDHWDEIELHSWQTLDGTEVLYQEGTLADILPVETILKELDERVGGIDNCVIFSGTVPVKDGFRFGSKFRYEMEDKKLNRKLSSEYEVDVISEEER